MDFKLILGISCFLMAELVLSMSPTGPVGVDIPKKQAKSGVKRYLKKVNYTLDISLRDDPSDPSSGLFETKASKHGPIFTHDSQSADGPISIRIAFSKAVLPSSTVQDLQNGLRYVVLDKVPMPGFNYPCGWDIYPQTPLSSFTDGVTIVSYQNGRLHFKVNTRFFAINGRLRRVVPPIGAPTPKYARFHVMKDIKGLIDVNMPITILA